MQALIDFDGWRKWKDAAIQNGLKDASTSDPRAGSMRKKKAITQQNAQKEKEALEKAQQAQSAPTSDLEKESSEETVKAGGA
jgi:hypothetical protein